MKRSGAQPDLLLLALSMLSCNQSAVDVSTYGQFNRYGHDPYRCISNEQDDKYEVTPDSGQMPKWRSCEETHSEAPTSSTTQILA